MEDELKIGAAISAANHNKFKTAHDVIAETIGLDCAPKDQPKSISEDEFVYYGDAIKALGNGKVGGYLVRFSSQDDPDLTGDFFTKDTELNIPEKLPVFYNHGLDHKMGKKPIGTGTSKIDDVGAWVETQLNMRDEYERAIYELAKAGKLGYSSGALSHLVDREPTKEGTSFIRMWYVGEASLTPTPAEPRNSVVSLKSLITGAPQESFGTLEAVSKTKPETPIYKEAEMPEITKEPEVDNTKVLIDAVKSLQATVTDMQRTLPAAMKAGYNVSVTHDEADTPFSSIGSQMEAIKNATLTQGRELAPRLRALNIKALGANELIGAEGGFMLEPTFAAGILAPLHDTGPFSSRANKIPIGPNSNGITIRAIDETNRTAGYRWGGILGYRLAEAGTKLATTPTFRLLEMRLKKYAVLVYASEEILQDSTALTGIISQGCSEELDFMVNDDILNGAGNAGPLGILKSGALISVSKEAGQAASTVVTQNIFKMWARMHPASKRNATWYINTDVTPQLYQLSLSVGTGGMPMYMAPGSLPNAPSGQLLGRPVVETEFNQTLGTEGDIVLADMTQYAMIDRDVQAASSIHVQFLTDQICYRFVYRVDGMPKIAKPLTPVNGSNTLSPFVTLAVRA